MFKARIVQDLENIWLKYQSEHNIFSLPNLKYIISIFGSFISKMLEKPESSFEIRNSKVNINQSNQWNKDLNPSDIKLFYTC